MTLAVAGIISLVVVCLALVTITIIRMRSKQNAKKEQGGQSLPLQSKKPPAGTDRHAEAVSEHSASHTSGSPSSPQGKEAECDGPISPSQPAGTQGTVLPGHPLSANPGSHTGLETVPDGSAEKRPAEVAGKNAEGIQKLESDDNVLGMFMPLGEEDANLSIILGELDDVDIRSLVDFAGKVSEELKA